MPKKYHHSPDEYNPTALGETPPRISYHGTPTNVTQSETGKKAGGTPGGVRQAGGTENKRAAYKTKSARVPEPGGGKTRWPNVDSYDDTKDF